MVNGWQKCYKTSARAKAQLRVRGTEGKCTPITKPGCTGKAKALKAKTFKKMAARKGRQHNGKRTKTFLQRRRLQTVYQ